MITLPFLLCLAAAFIITWLFIAFLKKREKNAQLRQLHIQTQTANLKIKPDSIQHEWVTLSEIDDEQFSNSSAKAVLINGQLKFLIDAENLHDLLTHNQLLKDMNEALHQANDDFDQHITGDYEL